MTPDAPLPGSLVAGRRVVECADCGRELTGRKARMWGRGRACRHKHGLDGPAPRTGRFEVEQDPLPEA